MGFMVILSIGEKPNARKPQGGMEFLVVDALK